MTTRSARFLISKSVLDCIACTFHCVRCYVLILVFCFCFFKSVFFLPYLYFSLNNSSIFHFFKNICLYILFCRISFFLFHHFNNFLGPIYSHSLYFLVRLFYVDLSVSICFSFLLDLLKAENLTISFFIVLLCQQNAFPLFLFYF